mgnify:CR=1 FL=1
MKDKPKIDISAIESLTDQYRADLQAYKERESLYIKTENQLKGTKQIVVEMASVIKQLTIEKDNLQAEIARLNEEIQLLEMQIKK